MVIVAWIGSNGTEHRSDPVTNEYARLLLRILREQGYLTAWIARP